MLKIIQGLLVLTLAAVSLGAQAAASGTATIHVYRLKQNLGSAYKPSIYCDGVALARIHNGAFFIANIEPGKHMIMAGRSEVGLFVDFKSGGQYYFRLDHKNYWVTGFSGRQPAFLSQLSAEEAEPEMAKLSEQSLERK